MFLSLYHQKDKKGQRSQIVFRFNLIFSVMRRFSLAIAAVLLCGTMSFASENRNSESKEPFAINFDKLSNYLQLSSAQADEVYKINDYFIDKQKETRYSKDDLREKKLLEAVYGNLKLMKEVLTQEQYRKYVTLLNVTNNNTHALTVE